MRLFAAAALMLLCAAASPARDMDPDRAKVEVLVTRVKHGEPGERRKALWKLSGGWVWGSAWVDEAFAARMLALAEQSAHDPVLHVRYAAGPLGQAAREWRARKSPQAEKDRAAFRRHERLRGLWIEALVVLGPIVSLIVGFLVIAGQMAAAFLIIHGETLLEGEVRSAWSLFRRSPALFLLPAFSALSFGLLLGLVMYGAFTSHPAADMRGRDVLDAALRIALHPLSLAACLAAFTLAEASNAAYLSSHVRSRLGEAAGLARGLWHAARHARPILSLTLAAGGSLIALDLSLRRAFGPLALSADTALRFSALLTESGTLLGLNTAFCCVLFDGLDADAAVRRAGEILEPEWRAAAKAVTATAIMRGDPVAAAFAAPAMAGYLGLITAYFYVSHEWLAAGGLYVVFGMGALSGICGAAFLLAFVYLLDGIFAAAFYLHARGQAALPLPAARSGASLAR